MPASALSTAAPARPLPEVLAHLRRHGVRRGVTDPSAPSQPPIATGHESLDAALRTGGLPRGSLTLLDALPGTGATTLALGTLAAAQAAGGLAAYLDLGRALDPATAARLGVQLEWLLIVRPTSVTEALELGGWLARSRLIDLLVLDLLGARNGEGAAVIERLPPLLSRTSATAVLLARGPLREAGVRAAGIRIGLERRAWLAVGRDLVGQRVEATVARHRWAAPGGRAALDLWFAEGHRIDRFAMRLAAPRIVPSAAQSAASAHDQPQRLRVLSA